MPREDTTLEVRESAILMQFLLQQLKGKNRDNIKSLLRNRQVWVNGQIVSQFNHELLPGHQVMIKWEKTAEGLPGRDIRLVYEDGDIVVIDKQAGLLSIATGTEKEATAYSLLSTYVKSQNPGNRIFVVHRLDRDTSGLMMFAKSSSVQSLLQRSWQISISERTYVALVKGRVEKPEGTIRSYLYESKSLIMHSTADPARGELAITHYRTLKAGKEYTLLEVSLETGKKNQIRVHMKEIGHGIAGDRKYGTGDNPLGRLGLHASVLAFLHPVTGKPLRFTSKIPAAFLKLV
jgi:23S rRNA pseudouridine1911/1915/1917 synthase